MQIKVHIQAAGCPVCMRQKRVIFANCKIMFVLLFGLSGVQMVLSGFFHDICGGSSVAADIPHQLTHLRL